MICDVICNVARKKAKTAGGKTGSRQVGAFFLSNFAMRSGHTIIRVCGTERDRMGHYAMVL